MSTEIATTSWILIYPAQLTRSLDCFC